MSSKKPIIKEFIKLKLINKKNIKISNFKNIKIINYQRYGINNHLGWFLNNRPQGHKTLSNVFDSKTNQVYIEFLSKIKKTDTLIASATK